MAHEYKPDVILMDMQMPIMDGYETIRALRMDEELRNIPVIALTASALESETGLILSYCRSYLRKPIRCSDLIERLAEVLLPTSASSVCSSEILLSASVNKESAATESGCCDSEAETDMETLELMYAALLERTYPVWQEVRSVMSNDDIQEFASIIIAIGKEFHHTRIQEYGEALFQYASSFKIGKMQQSFLRFPAMLEEYAERLHQEMIH
jgi:response regulator RpfG family c-di-GMP phosphodiesterase